MGRIEKDVFGDGFTVYSDDGSTEHFSKNITNDGYSGSKGTKVDKHFFSDGYTVHNKSGSEEKFERNIFNSDYSGNKGTKTSKDVFGTGASFSGGAGTGGAYSAGNSNSNGNTFAGLFGMLLAVVFGIPALIFLYLFCLGVTGIITNLVLFAVPAVFWLVKRKIDPAKRQMLSSWETVLVSIMFLFAIVFSIYSYDKFGFLSWVGFAVSGLLMIALQSKLSGTEDFSAAWWLQCLSFIMSWMLSMTLEYSIDHNRALPAYIYLTIAAPIIIQTIVAIVHTVRFVSSKKINKATPVVVPAKSATVQPNQPNRSQPPKTQTKIGNNDPCPCGSGKKYKKCCGEPAV